jgi:hypothetical protein
MSTDGGLLIVLFSAGLTVDVIKYIAKGGHLPHCPDKSCNHLIKPTDRNCPRCGQEFVPSFWNKKLRARREGDKQYCPCCDNEVLLYRGNRSCHKCGLEMLLPFSEEVANSLTNYAVFAAALGGLYGLVKFIKWAWYH